MRRRGDAEDGAAEVACVEAEECVAVGVVSAAAV